MALNHQLSLVPHMSILFYSGNLLCQKVLIDFYLLIEIGAACFDSKWFPYFNIVNNDTFKYMPMHPDSNINLMSLPTIDQKWILQARQIIINNFDKFNNESLIFLKQKKMSILKSILHLKICPFLKSIYFLKF